MVWHQLNIYNVKRAKNDAKKNGSRGNLHTTLEALTVEGSDCTVFVEAVAVELTFRVLWAERLLLRSWKHIRGGYGF